MSELEYKLIDLGYMQDWQNQYIYYKSFSICNIMAGLTQNKKECWLKLTDIGDIKNEEDLKEVFRVFNIMQKDKEELKDAKLVSKQINN